MLDPLNIAEWIVALATVGGLIMVAWQIRESRKLAQQAAAIQSWSEYLRLGLDNPELGETWIALKSLRISSAVKLVSGETIRSQRYLWFLSIMLEAAENLIAAYPEGSWKLTVEENLRYHRPALKAFWQTEGRFYSPELRKIVTGIMAEPEE